MRVALGIEYAGEQFCGWQLQEGVPTVQGEVEQALARISGHPIRVTTAGRTDTGVHAFGQVVHFDTTVDRPDRAWMLGTNRYLPPSVRVRWSQRVDDSFSARFSALSRTYRYQILNRDVAPAISQQRVTWCRRPLSEIRMATAAAALCGTHDFSAYRASSCQSHTPVRQMESITIKRAGQIVSLELTANAFLHHMVRNIAGVLIRIGVGDAAESWAKEVLIGRDRARGGITASAAGLYLIRVAYPVHYALPAGGDEWPLW